MNGLSEGMNALPQAMDHLREAIHSLPEEINSLQKAMNSLGEGINCLRQAIPGLREADSFLREATDARLEATDSLSEAAAGFPERADVLAEAVHYTELDVTHCLLPLRLERGEGRGEVSGFFPPLPTWLIADGRSFPFDMDYESCRNQTPSSPRWGRMSAAAVMFGS